MRIRMGVLAALAAGWAGSAWAQQGGTDTERLAQALGVSPYWAVRYEQVVAGDVDPGPGEPLLNSDQTTLVFALGAKRELAPGVTLTTELSANLVNDLEVDEDQGSGLGLLVKLAGGPTLGPFRPFVSYSAAPAWKGVLGDYAHVDHTAVLGAEWETLNFDYCKLAQPGDPRCRVNFSITPSLGSVWSDDARRERLTPQVVAKLAGTSFHRTKWFAEAKAETRRFKHADTPGLPRRRDDRYTVAAGVDLARFLLKDSYPWVQKLEVAGRWVTNASNRPDGDYSRWQVVPSVAIGAAF